MPVGRCLPVPLPHQVADLRVGIGPTSAAAISRSWGNGKLSCLFVEQQPTTMSDPQEWAEELDSGRHLVAMGLHPKEMEVFQQEHPGRGMQTTLLDLPDAGLAGMTTLLYFIPRSAPDRRPLRQLDPHPRGEEILTAALPTNGARNDIPPVLLDSIATAGQTYYEPDREANFAHTAEMAVVVGGLMG